jgi:serine/threonine protein kinase
MLEHEIDMYEHLMKSPDYLRNVSELLYADIPSEYHGIEHYDNSYFIFRFVEGVPLDTLIKSFQKNKRYITLEKLRGWGTNLLEILEFLKTNKVVHRDIKPANLFLDTTHDRLVLFDFGSACIGEDCKAYQFYGTRDYAKPDSFRLFEHFPNEYIYTSENDAYAVKIIMSRDIQTLVSPESIDQYNQMLNDLGLVL